MKFNNKNKKTCQKILEALRDGDSPTDPIVTWDGELHLTSKIHPLNENEIVLFDGFCGFGDTSEIESELDVFKFIEDMCEPRIFKGTFGLKCGKGRYSDEFAISIDDAESVNSDGITSCWYDTSPFIEKIYDEVGVGELGMNDEEAWIWVDSSQMELYNTNSYFFEFVSAIQNNGVEQVTIVTPYNNDKQAI